ncbi:MAG: hypothetical protein NC432_06390 [Roseburia sp.]|nr:hypothetical protein [Roseburia sp.]MCM1096641.1 hypothetical protein [Ruminococcus flavefaciens]
MDTFYKKALKRGLLTVLSCGMALAVSACGREARDAGADESGNVQASAGQEQEAQSGNGQTSVGQMQGDESGNGQASVRQMQEAQSGNGQDQEDGSGDAQAQGNKTENGQASNGKAQEDEPENTAGTADISYEALPITYSLDNSSRVPESKSGVFTGDWDRDGVEDTLTVKTGEREGSEIIQKLKLTLSGCPVDYILEDADCDFIDILAGDFDGDEEAEILLLFDMRYAGANGCCGLQLLDKAGTEYANIAEGFFTGFDYTMEAQTGENSGYRIVNGESGEEFFLKEENVYESAIATVTGWYYLEILEGAEQNYIRLRQYAAGDDMTNHVGDMITVLSAGDGGLRLLDERVN